MIFWRKRRREPQRTVHPVLPPKSKRDIRLEARILRLLRNGHRFSFPVMYPTYLYDYPRPLVQKTLRRLVEEGKIECRRGRYGLVKR